MNLENAMDRPIDMAIYGFVINFRTLHIMYVQQLTNVLVMYLNSL